MAAVTDAVPLLLPMVSVTGTGFTVPVRLAFRVPARNAYRLVPSGAITTSKATPLIVPDEIERPKPFPREGAGRDGHGKGADLEGHRLGDRINPVAGAPQKEARPHFKERTSPIAPRAAGQFRGSRFEMAGGRDKTPGDRNSPCR